ncbi:GNAT family N-acetyltransferase [Polyangium mundeleinium]|uniref:GNAT family N-acetyltransferase n=1 Tax=Polyangium mundeleinium TaxID=2995306 RepID=A0ABT5F720_9BACT|nr:GNAT family N-acetyltransferase [Polyangium mundeleinium]MDC0749761.1 GNAT family N-acetyltransferase [Polyangium mundeleinium]
MNSVSPARPSLDPNRLEIRLLDEAVIDDAQGFSCGDSDLDEFLLVEAMRLQVRHIVRTYVAYYEGCLVGFVSLMTDSVTLETKERKLLALGHHDHPVIPALKIARLGVSTSFRATHRGCGESLVRFAWAMALESSERVGCRLLTVDAYEASVPFYERLGFLRNRAKEYRERPNTSMRLDVHAPRPPSWLSEPTAPLGGDAKEPSDA